MEKGERTVLWNAWIDAKTALRTAGDAHYIECLREAERAYTALESAALADGCYQHQDCIERWARA